MTSELDSHRARVEAWVAKVVAAAPPPTAEQAARLAALLPRPTYENHTTAGGTKEGAK